MQKTKSKNKMPQMMSQEDEMMTKEMDRLMKSGIPKAMARRMAQDKIAGKTKPKNKGK